MATLQLVTEARKLGMHLRNKPARLYRRICKEIPNIMQIYDIVHMGEKDIKKAVRSHFYDNATVQDERVIEMLCARGYMDLEDTMLYHKQKAHLMLLLEGPVTTDGLNLKLLTENSTEDEQLARSEMM